MYPKIFGIFNTYGLMIGIGVLLCLWVFHKCAQKKGLDPKFIDYIEWVAIFAIVGGVFTSILWQSIYSYIENPSAGFGYNGLTFIGGLMGGVIVFLIMYFAKRNKFYDKLIDILPIAPCCITIAHGFGRIGCFFAGCCYGIETDSFLGVKFPGMTTAVYPTQLFEAIFLLTLFGILMFLLLKFNFKYNMYLYLICYGTFRFFIEFIRGDDRGKFIGNISPSQFWSIVMVVAGIALWIYFAFFFKDKRGPRPIVETTVETNAEANVETNVDANTDVNVEEVETPVEEVEPNTEEVNETKEEDKTEIEENNNNEGKE